MFDAKTDRAIITLYTAGLETYDTDTACDEFENAETLLGTMLIMSSKAILEDRSNIHDEIVRGVVLALTDSARTLWIRVDDDTKNSMSFEEFLGVQVTMLAKEILGDFADKLGETLSA